MNKRSLQVSWLAAWRDGVAVTLNHKILILLAFFATLCERAVGLSSRYTEASTDVVLAATWNMLRELKQNLWIASSPSGSSAVNETVLLISLGLFVVGLFTLVGILGLIRDLMVNRGYQARNVVKRGARYFWPVLKFKVPIYLLLGSLAVIMVLCAPNAGSDSPLFWVWASPAAVLSAAAFVMARVVLSLGDKIIVTENPSSVITVYRRIPRLIGPHAGQAIRFYSAMLVIIGVSFFASFVMAEQPLPAPVGATLIVFFLAFVTVTTKVAAFSFYLQLAGYNEEAANRTIQMPSAPTRIEREAV